MKPKVGEWLSEYAIPKNIHPAVIGYIMTKYQETGKSEEIDKMDYFYEEPEVGESKLDEYGCKGRTNDPRGWVSVSDTLYAFEEKLAQGAYIGKNVEYILEMSLNTKLRHEWATDFINFYNIPVLTVDDIVNNTYTEDDLPENISERFACISSLLSVDIENVEIVREFIREKIGAEYLKTFDMCWVCDDEERMLKLQELEAKKKVRTK